MVWSKREAKREIKWSGVFSVLFYLLLVGVGFWLAGNIMEINQIKRDALETRARIEALEQEQAELGVMLEERLYFWKGDVDA